MAWSPDSAKRLLSNQDFLDLFEDITSPLKQQLDLHTRVALDPAYPDDRARTAKCKRSGILEVMAAVKNAVDADLAPPEEAPKKRPRVSAGKYLSRRL